MIILLQYRLMIDINYAYFKIHFRFNIYDELLVDKTGRSLLSHFPCTSCFILSLQERGYTDIPLSLIPAVL